MIPNVVHFIYPAWTNTRPLSMLNYLAVKSVIKVHKPDIVKFWIDRDPVDNEWWDKIKPMVAVNRRPMSANYKGIDVRFPQYRSDITRLEILLEEGGIYMDTDVITLRSLDYFMRGTFTIAKEPNETSLSNAIMFAQAGDPFVAEWLVNMPEAIRSNQWANGGVVLPLQIAQTNKYTINMEDSDLLCPFDLHYPYIFEPRLKRAAKALMRNAYAIHIYETYWRDTIKYIDRAWVEENDTVFSDMVKA